MLELSQSTIYEFDGFRLDAQNRRLFSRETGKPVPLTPKALELLLVLVRSQGRVLTKDELLEAVWDNSFVQESNLSQTIFVLRKALGDNTKEPRLILTAPNRGYRFIAAVKVISPDADDGILDSDLIGSETHFESVDLDGATEVETQPDEPNLTASPATTFTPSVFRQKKGIVAALGLVVVLFLGLAYWSTRPAPPPKTITQVKSIAVLPFKNIGGQIDDAYLGQGLAEVLITELSNLKTVVVRPTTAVTKYGEASPDPKRIGSELDVEAVVMGRVQKFDENIRVTVQLVRVSDGATLWAETFDDKFTNIFAVQDSIATQVTSSLAITLTSGERQQLAKRYTANTEAFQLYLQGRYFWNKRSEEGLQKAVEFFTQATGKDPGFARAYSGLTDSYMLMGILDLGMNPREAITRAKAAAQKAIALDDTLAEPHTSLAFMAYNYDFDWVNADRQFRRAIELNPNYATAHHWYSQFLNCVKRFDESEAEIKEALQLDPSSLIINVDYGAMFYYSRRYDQAVAQYRKTLEFEPRFALAHQELGRAYTFQQRYDEAIAEYNQAIEISGRRPYLLALLGYAYGMSGKRTEAETLLQELEALSKQRIVLPFNFITIHLGLNDSKKAMEWMEINFKERQSALIVLGIEPRYDPLRSEPRFQEMLRELKLN